MAFKRKLTKKLKNESKETNFHFWNTQKQYNCKITAPINVEKYRLKEVFDKFFVCKTTDPFLVQPTIFKHLDESITFEIEGV